jgi:DNA invertase Pin-like site-specific DNA recombinase
MMFVPATTLSAPPSAPGRSPTSGRSSSPDLERRTVEWFELAAELDAAGITELHTRRDGIVRIVDDVAGIKAVLNAGEVRRIKRRVNDKLAERAAQGRPHGGVPFGYRRRRLDNGRDTLTIERPRRSRCGGQRMPCCPGGR